MTNHREKEKPERLSPVEDAEQWFKFADSDFTTATLVVEQEDHPSARYAIFASKRQRSI
jgi:hypothetical protein